jgi:bacteriocin-like protein
MNNLQDLSKKELKSINGGSIILLAFMAGFAYGYVKEKFASKQWSL